MTLEVTRGDDETLTVLVTDPDNNDEPVDLTGAALTFMVKRFPGDADVDALIAKTNGDGLELANQSTNKGQATITLDADETAELKPGIRRWELQSVDSDDQVKTLADGHIRIKADLIREATGS